MGVGGGKERDRGKLTDLKANNNRRPRPTEG